MSDRECAWGEGCSTLICIAMHCILMCILALQTHCILTCILNFSLHLHPLNGLVGVGVFDEIRCACVRNVHSSLHHCCYVDAWGVSWELGVGRALSRCWRIIWEGRGTALNKQHYCSLSQSGLVLSCKIHWMTGYHLCILFTSIPLVACLKSPKRR